MWGLFVTCYTPRYRVRTGWRGRRDRGKYRYEAAVSFGIKREADVGMEYIADSH